MTDLRLRRYVRDVLRRLDLTREQRRKAASDIMAGLVPLAEQGQVEQAIARFGTPQEVAEAFAEAGYRLRRPRNWRPLAAAGALAVAGVLGALASVRHARQQAAAVAWRLVPAGPVRFLAAPPQADLVAALGESSGAPDLWVGSEV